MIYLDYNATTPLCPAAREAMLPYFDRHFGNASSIHKAGREARAALDNARDQLASLLRVKPHEIIFTGGGTEANNLALFGLTKSAGGRGHLICNKAEHHAVLHVVEHLEEDHGYEVTWLDLSAGGLIDPNQLADSLRADTRLVSIMTANNETGVLQPMREISAICRERGVLLHSDMVQSFGKVDLDLSLVDAASFAAHKFYGPKGVGFLYLRSGLSIEPMLLGGSHENQRRAGTENVAGIAGMAAAAAYTLRDLPAEQERQKKMRDRLGELIKQAVPASQANGDPSHRLTNTLNVSFLGLPSEMLLIGLDLKGVCASSGSACMVGSAQASHVLLAMGLPAAAAQSAARFSLGKPTTAEEIESAGQIIAQVAERMSKRKGASQYAVA